MNNKTTFYLIGAILSIIFISISIFVVINNDNQPEETMLSTTSNSTTIPTVLEPEEVITSSSIADNSKPGESPSPILIPNPDYINLDGLYFLPSSQHNLFKSEFNDFLGKTGRKDIKDVYIFSEIDTEDNNFYMYWMILDSKEVIRGMYNYELDAYSFMIEYEGELYEAYQKNNPDGIDPYLE